MGWALGGYDRMAIDLDGLSQVVCLSKGRHIFTGFYTFSDNEEK